MDRITELGRKIILRTATKDEEAEFDRLCASEEKPGEEVLEDIEQAARDDEWDRRHRRDEP